MYSARDRVEIRRPAAARFKFVICSIEWGLAGATFLGRNESQRKLPSGKRRTSTYVYSPARHVIVV
jgi:hypothetical protein